MKKLLIIIVLLMNFNISYGDQYIEGEQEHFSDTPLDADQLLLKYINSDSIFLLIDKSKYNEAYWAAKYLNEYDGGESASYVYLQAIAAIKLNICVKSIYESLSRPLTSRNMDEIFLGNSIRSLIKMDSENCMRFSDYLPASNLENLINLINDYENNNVIKLKYLESELKLIFDKSTYTEYESIQGYIKLYDDFGMPIYK
ncbi:hypothetical protein [Marinicellulosiphila megalodicopiae]|uniref:hypothetical protein n=1 Tax=Marinicellulosiphila megalodicopiae TaxID=2724896 RepID=UPI003BB1095D